MNINYFKTYEAIEKHDEDAPPIAEDNVLIICDGMGGTGSNKHTYDGQIRTSAYLGSRFTSNFVKKFISLNREKLFSSDLDKTMIDLKNYLHKQLRNIVEENNFTKRIKGKILELLPTTMFVTVFNQKDDDTIEVVVIWAGDSRIYMLNEQNGMMQVTKDNINMDNDALQNMIESSNVSNNINAEEELNFELYYYKFNITCPTVIFACSDGLFDYANTPMQFEQSILKCIMSLDSSNCNDNFSSLGDAIGQHLQEVKLHDDCTLAGACIGFENVSTLQNAFKKRLELVDNMCDTYITNIKEYSANKEQITDNLKSPQNQDIIKDTTRIFKLILDFIIRKQCDDIVEKQEFEHKIEKLEIIVKEFEPYINAFLNNNSDYFKLINDICTIKKEIYNISSEKNNLVGEQAKIAEHYNHEFKQCFLDYKFKEIQQEYSGSKSNNFFNLNPIINYVNLLNDYNLLITYKKSLEKRLNQFIDKVQNRLNDTNIVSDFITINSDIIAKIHNKYGSLEKLQSNIDSINIKLKKSECEVKKYILEKEYPHTINNKRSYLSKSEFISAQKLQNEYCILTKSIEKLSNDIEENRSIIENKRKKFILSNIDDIIDNVITSIKTVEEIDKLKDLSPEIYDVLVKYWGLNQSMENIYNNAQSHYNICMNIWHEYKINYEFFNKCECIYNTKINDEKLVNV